MFHFSSINQLNFKWDNHGQISGKNKDVFEYTFPKNPIKVFLLITRSVLYWTDIDSSTQCSNNVDLQTICPPIWYKILHIFCHLKQDLCLKNRCAKPHYSNIIFNFISILGFELYHYLCHITLFNGWQKLYWRHLVFMVCLEFLVWKIFRQFNQLWHQTTVLSYSLKTDYVSSMSNWISWFLSL